jgi:rare lipoprotein A
MALFGCGRAPEITLVYSGSSSERSEETEMAYSHRLFISFGIGGTLLSLLLPGCTRLISREKTPPPPMVTPQAKEEEPQPEGPKVEQVGNASWYGAAHNGKETASGETFDQNKLTAASPTLPLGTKAVVTNLETGKSVAVTINDRGPFKKGRKIDLSRAAAQKIGMTKEGVSKVKIETRSRRKPIKKVARQRAKSRVAPIATRTDMPTVSP